MQDVMGMLLENVNEMMLHHSSDCDWDWHDDHDYQLLVRSQVKVKVKRLGREWVTGLYEYGHDWVAEV